MDKYKFPTRVLKTPMLVTSPEAEYMAHLWCDRLPLRIGNYLFPSDLIVLESQGLDVILGMDWLSKYEGTLTAPVSRFCLPPQKEEGSSMYPGMCQRGLK